MTPLIERAERAQTREEAVAVFQEAVSVLEPNDSALFHMWLTLAEATQGADAAFGYLLLAAMAVVPEGWNVDVRSKGTHWHCGVWHGARNFYRYARIPACALLAAILKANEAKDDR